MCKDVFIDRHKRSNVIKDWDNFLIKIEDFKPYMIKFEKDVEIKPKVYLSNYKIGDNN